MQEKEKFLEKRLGFNLETKETNKNICFLSYNVGKKWNKTLGLKLIQVRGMRRKNICLLFKIFKLIRLFFSLEILLVQQKLSNF